MAHTWSSPVCQLLGRRFRFTPQHNFKFISAVNLACIRWMSMVLAFSWSGTAAFTPVHFHSNNFTFHSLVPHHCVPLLSVIHRPACLSSEALSAGLLTHTYVALPSSWPTSVSVRGVNNQTQDSSLRPFDHSTSLVTWASLSPGIFISLESQLQCPVLWLLRLLSLAFCHLGLLKLSVLWALRSLTLTLLHTSPLHTI